MKLMTINTHSLIEPNYEQKLEQFAQVLLRERPDVLAMQEVNQLAEGRALEDGSLEGFVRCPGFDKPVREGNHAARLAELLREKGLSYHWTWISAKLGYDRYDEGLALFSLRPIRETDQFLISQSEDYQYWKTRKVLGIQASGLEDLWFYTVHMGWWDDEEEPFLTQWETFNARLAEKGRMEKTVWLMGDFNSPDTSHGRGYTAVCQSGWLDSYQLALEKDSGVTVDEVIDGWRERTDELDNSKETAKGMRLDYLFCSRFVPVASSQVICSGDPDPVVSDHYGVMIEIGERGSIS